MLEPEGRRQLLEILLGVKGHGDAERDSSGVKEVGSMHNVSVEIDVVGDSGIWGAITVMGVRRRVNFTLWESLLRRLLSDT